MATSPDTFSKVKNLLRKMDQSIDSARSKRLSSNGPPPVVQQHQSPPPPTHSIQAAAAAAAAAAANNVPIRPRAMARPQMQRPAI